MFGKFNANQVGDTLAVRGTRVDVFDRITQRRTVLHAGPYLLRLGKTRGFSSGIDYSDWARIKEKSLGYSEYPVGAITKTMVSIGVIVLAAPTRRSPPRGGGASGGAAAVFRLQCQEHAGAAGAFQLRRKPGRHVTFNDASGRIPRYNMNIDHPTAQTREQRYDRTRLAHWAETRGIGLKAIYRDSAGLTYGGRP
ncbi:hypothetical protein EI94DRAFT_1698633 [Lactarius quietus]|nr:hypothetical protein EI94DRAFT_1698633 [Lactarius quietus]